jgi:hypothetical protein
MAGWRSATRHHTLGPWRGVPPPSGVAARGCVPCRGHKRDTAWGAEPLGAFPCIPRPTASWPGTSKVLASRRCRCRRSRLISMTAFSRRAKWRSSSSTPTGSYSPRNTAAGEKPGAAVGPCPRLLLRRSARAAGVPLVGGLRGRDPPRHLDLRHHESRSTDRPR